MPSPAGCRRTRKRLLALTRRLQADLPHTRAAFAAGRIPERRAEIVARETECLTVEHRLEVDRRIAGDPGRIEAMGNRELAARVREIAYELDARAWVRRRARAEADRRVTCRPAPDVMTQLSVLLPVKQGVAVMADTLAERVVAPGSSAGGGDVGVTINVVVPDTVLLGGDGPAYVEGHGPGPRRPRPGARDRHHPARRVPPLYAAPGTGRLVAMDSRSTSFPGALATFIALRDQTCRTPWCDAPIRHSDHVKSRDEGGETSEPNGQGLCEGCNHAKQAVGWRARPRPGPRHTVETTTPTGHRYRSRAPAAGQPTPPGEPDTERDLLRHARAS